MFSFGMVVMFLVGIMPAGTAKTVLSIVSGLICSFAIGALFAVAYSVPSQLAADEEKETGVSNGAMYFAVQGLVSGIATGLATGVVLTALKGSEESASSAITYITLISAAGTLAAFLCTFGLPNAVKNIGKEHKEK